MYKRQLRYPLAQRRLPYPQIRGNPIARQPAGQRLSLIHISCCELYSLR
ncbi:hypothetical protein [Sphingobium sp. B2]|nr:hypothetical protein [Sphingobium sp. B2]